jgi:hypothetical protein
MKTAPSPSRNSDLRPAQASKAAATNPANLGTNIDQLAQQALGRASQARPACRDPEAGKIPGIRSASFERLRYTRSFPSAGS